VSEELPLLVNALLCDFLKLVSEHRHFFEEEERRGSYQRQICPCYTLVEGKKIHILKPKGETKGKTNLTEGELEFSKKRHEGDNWRLGVKGDLRRET